MSIRKLNISDLLIGQQFREIIDALNNNKKIAPTLLNSVTDYGGGYESASYIKTASGIVAISAVVSLPVSFTAGSIIFNLPEKYRPLYQHVFSVYSSAGVQRVDVLANGDVKSVTLAGGASVWLSLSGISFIAEQ